MAPAYAPGEHGVGVLHIGAGAFHRAHQAAYTDAALAAKEGDWRIVAVSLRSTELVDALAAQDGLYSLTERGADGGRTRIVGSIAETIAAARDMDAAPEAFCREGIRVVTLTVTEKAYGLDRKRMDIDENHPAVAADLAAPRRPSGVLGIVTEGLRRRRARSLPPPAILCCDNLPENGALLRAGVIGFARRADPELADWIAANVAFPSSMVDRITPVATSETLAQARSATGFDDLAAVECEAFTQWVIEDHFPRGRPAWEQAGATFVSDVTPFEKMKLRMLNGAHSLIAWSGFVAGHKYVRDAMQDAALAGLTDRYMRAAAATLDMTPGFDLDDYRQDLLTRFANPSIAHQTYQIAMDGTEKLPQRILAPATEALTAGRDTGLFAFAAAAWMRYCRGVDEKGRPYDLRDPREAEIKAAIAGCETAGAISGALLNLAGVFPEPLIQSESFRTACTAHLDAMLTQDMAHAIAGAAA